MEFNNTVGLNALEGIGELHDMTMMAEGTTLADNLIRGNYIPHNTTMVAESTILADNQVRGKYTPHLSMKKQDGGGSPKYFQITMQDNAAKNTVVNTSNSLDDIIDKENTFLVDTKKRTIFREYKQNDQYNFEMMTAEGHDKVDTFTMEGNATENTFEAIGM